MSFNKVSKVALWRSSEAFRTEAGVGIRGRRGYLDTVKGDARAMKEEGKEDENVGLRLLPEADRSCSTDCSWLP